MEQGIPRAACINAVRATPVRGVRKKFGGRGAKIVSRTPRRTHSESAAHVRRPSRGTVGTGGGKGCAAAISSPRNPRTGRSTRGEDPHTPGVPTHPRSNGIPARRQAQADAGSARPTLPPGAVAQLRAVERQPHSRADTVGMPTPVESPPRQPAPAVRVAAASRPPSNRHRANPHAPARPAKPRLCPGATAPPAPTRSAPSAPTRTAPPAPTRTAPPAPTRTAPPAPPAPTPHRAVRANPALRCPRHPLRAKPRRPHRRDRVPRSSSDAASHRACRRSCATAVPPMWRAATFRCPSPTARDSSRPSPSSRCTSSSTDRTAAGVARAVRVPHQLMPSSNKNLLRQLLRA